MSQSRKGPKLWPGNHSCCYCPATSSLLARLGVQESREWPIQFSVSSWRSCSGGGGGGGVHGTHPALHLPPKLSPWSAPRGFSSLRVLLPVSEGVTACLCACVRWSVGGVSLEATSCHAEKPEQGLFSSPKLCVASALQREDIPTPAMTGANLEDTAPRR